MEAVESPSPEDPSLEHARRNIIARIGSGSLELPLLPHVACQLLPLLSNPDSDARKLAELIRQDQALTSHVLRIANSAAFGGRSRVESLQHAVARIGFELLRGLIFAISLQSGIFTSRRYEAQARDWWRQALTTALFSERIAAIGGHHTELAFLCGLLHNVGKPIVVNAIVQLAAKEDLDLERNSVLALVDELHTEVGALLAGRWSLPAAVAETIRSTADPAFMGSTSHEVRAAVLAAHLARRAGNPDPSAEPHADALDELAGRLHAAGPYRVVLSSCDEIVQQVDVVVAAGAANES